MGAERFFLYDNASTDDHREVLAPLIASGAVIPHDWPKWPAQLQVYADCLERHGEESRWIAFLDLDEFLFSPTGRTVAELLPEFEEFPALGVNCVPFGTSGHATPPPGLVIENYVRRCRLDHPRNRIIKTVLDPRRAVSPGNDPHFFRYLDNERAVDENKDRIQGHQTTEVSCSLFRVNHYITRSQAERERKLYRRLADTADRRRRPERARERDRMLNDELDEELVRYAPAIRSAMGAA